MNVTDSDIEVWGKVGNTEVVYKNNLFTAESDYNFHVRLLKISNINTVRRLQKIIYPLFEFAIENFREFLSAYAKKHEEKVFVIHKNLLALLKAQENELAEPCCFRRCRKMDVEYAGRD